MRCGSSGRRRLARRTSSERLVAIRYSQRARPRGLTGVRRTPALRKANPCSAVRVGRLSPCRPLSTSNSRFWRAAAGGERGDVRSRLSGQPHDRNLAIGLLLVLAIARSALRNTGQSLSPLRPLQGLTANLEPLCPDLQPDVVGMLCHVEKPGRVACGSAERGGNEPRVVSVREAPDRGCPCAPRLRPTRGEKDHREPRARTDTLLARAAVPPHVPLADELDERNRHPRSASATGIETNGHVRCLEKPPGASRSVCWRPSGHLCPATLPLGGTSSTRGLTPASAAASGAREHSLGGNPQRR